jgi:hypothetical protein
LLLPRERNKTLTGLAALVPGADRQRLHHFAHDAPWDSAALNARRLDLWRGHPDLGPPHIGATLMTPNGINLSRFPGMPSAPGTAGP